MSLSNPPKATHFQAATWKCIPATGTVKATGSLAESRGNSSGGFESVSSPKKDATAPTEFVSPYVSAEKLRQLNASTRKLQQIDEPDPEEILRQAYEKGFAMGEAAGLVAGQQQAKQIAGQIQGILTNVSAMWQQLLENYETQLIGLVCRIAEKVVYGQVEIDQEMVKRAILNAFCMVPEPIGVTIEVNPKDYDYIETIKEDFFSHIASLKDISVLASPSIEPGGCYIRTKAGEVDATIEARLDAVRKSLVEANGKVKGEPGKTP
jgi:flagellar assembly protein FliH